MGNGALPNGPSYRAHPRLYHLGRTDWGRKRPPVWGKRTCSGVTAERDQLSPENTVRAVIAVQKIRIATPHFNASLRLAAHENHEVGMISGLGANPFIRRDQ